ncbi:MAG: PH domain-containing protein [Acidimicrobiales bacterium]
MGYPRKLLTPGEDVVVEAYPSWSVLVRPVLTVLVVIGACVAVLFTWLSAPISILYVVAALIGLVGAWFIARIVAWRSRLLVITTSRVIYRWGVVRRTGREIPLNRVQDVTYRQGLMERLVGAGSLMIESAGASGQEPFRDIRRPAEMQSLINQLITGDYRRQAPPSSPRTAELQPVRLPAPIDPRGAGSTPVGRSSGEVLNGALADQMRELERLHDLGLLTEAEFDRGRRQLLGME